MSILVEQVTGTTTSPCPCLVVPNMCKNHRPLHLVMSTICFEHSSIMLIDPITAFSSGGSRISQMGAPTPEFGAKTYYYRPQGKVMFS